MTETAFTRLVGCDVPLQLAPMGGGIGSPNLAVAVSQAGALGMLSSWYPMPVAEQLSFALEQTTAPVGMGFFAFDLAQRLAELELAAARCRVVDLFWGRPDADVVSRIHAGGALAVWQVGSPDEARAAQDVGCDVVVAQGVEAGGHVRGTAPLRQLLDEVVGAVTVPVLAAGGISTHAHLARVLDAGAAGARIGTRFVATRESAAHPDYLTALVDAGSADTELTTAFYGGWEDAPHRVLRRAIDAASACPDEVVGESSYAGEPWPVMRWSALPPSTFCTGRIDAMAMYAGCGVGEIDRVCTVAEVVAEMTGQTIAR